MSAPYWPLLALLADGQPHHISSLATQLGQKPPQLAEVWQHMPAHIRGLLRQHNGHWRLVRPLAILSANDVTEGAQAYGFQATLLPQTTSTNDVLMALARQSVDAVQAQVRVAYEQTAGRGRQGKQWQNRLGECLMLSVAWTFDRIQAELGGLAMVVALAACRALHQAGIRAQIKWPNDLVLGADKLGGILIETLRRSGQTIAVIGIGLNFVVPKGLAQTTSVQTVMPHTSVRRVYTGLLRFLAEMLPQFAQHGLRPFLDDYQHWHRDQHQTVHLLQAGQAFVEGEVLGVTADGALRLHTADGEQHFVSGEISLRPGTAPLPAARTAPLLLLDAGNSKLKWAWVTSGRIVHHNKAAYHDLGLLRREWQERGLPDTQIIGCAVCGQTKQQAVIRALPTTIRWLGSMTQALGVRNHYRHVAEHGADRWFNVLGSRHFSQHACVIVSCGTAITVDALTDDNQYLGGSILPGFHLMKQSLAQHTAHLQCPLGKHYPFATTTANAIASGLMDAVCGAILLMHERLRQHIGQGKPADLIITGGGANKLVKIIPATFALDNHIEIVDNLAIYGLLNWIEHA